MPLHHQRSSPRGSDSVDDYFLLALAKAGDRYALERLVGRYRGFVRLKASSYFLAGGDAEDLVQEGLVGLHKAIRDYRTDRGSSFRNFAELCITRQVLTAVKAAMCNKHKPLDRYASFASTPPGVDDDDAPTLEEMLAGPSSHEPANRVVSTEELQELVACLSTTLSARESQALALRLDGHSYEDAARRLGCDEKAIDTALQRVRRKVRRHLAERAVPA